MNVRLDRAKAADLGVQLNDAADALRLLVGGDQVSTYNEGGEQDQVHLRAEAADRTVGRGGPGSCRSRRCVWEPSHSRTSPDLNVTVHLPTSAGSVASAR